MTNIVVSNPNYIAQSGSISLSSATTARVELLWSNPGTVEVYTGAFTYSGGNSLPTGGTITAINQTYNGTPVVSLTGLNIPVADYIQSIFSDGVVATNLLYGGADTMLGSVFGEYLNGLGGNDSIIALDGDDTVSGGAGNDDINGNVGRDSVSGGDGADFVRGGKDNDSVYGDGGDDPHVNGNIGDDQVFGGLGNDTCYGGQGQDTVHGNEGNDLVAGDLGYDILYGDLGSDRFEIRVGSQVDWVADFRVSEGDKIQMAAGTIYAVTSISNQVVIDLGNGDQLGLAGIAAGTFDPFWIVFV